MDLLALFRFEKNDVEMAWCQKMNDKLFIEVLTVMVSGAIDKDWRLVTGNSYSRFITHGHQPMPSKSGRYQIVSMERYIII
ncbi:hypothetical protein [Photobacterium leiognathi]|uniref:hypothetical protein n=1 Tax=Photobacterium leiognathi TaxID=553611 RepID=UPI00273A33A9|nr:hypothetical protein [Photobacterium leiognathi]